MERASDYSGLFAPVSADDVSAYRAAERLRNPDAESRRITRLAITIVSAILGTIVLASFILPTLFVLGVGVMSGTDPRDQVLVLPLIIVAIVRVVLVVRALRRSGSVWIDRVCMNRFAPANGLAYASESPSPSYPTTYQRLLRIVSTVGAKTLTRTDRYVDERIGTFEPTIVAPQGRRLRRSFSRVGVSFIVLFLVIWFGGIVSSFLN